MKKITLGLLFISAIAVSSYAELNNPDNIKTTKIDCDSGLKGFKIEITSPKIDNSIAYNSCIDRAITVLDKDGKIISGGSEEPYLGESVVINGKKYEFPAGYTEPLSEFTPDETCNGAFSEFTLETLVSCQKYKGTSISENWLHVINAGYEADTRANGWTNFVYASDLQDISNLANLKYADGINLALTNVTDISPLSNLEKANFVGLYRMNITELNGMKNLKSLRLGYFGYNSLLTDISGLNEVEEIKDHIWLDKRDYEVKLDGDSYICNNLDKVHLGPPDAKILPEDKHLICND